MGKLVVIAHKPGKCLAVEVLLLLLSTMVTLSIHCMESYKRFSKIAMALSHMFQQDLPERQRYNVMLCWSPLIYNAWKSV